MDSTSITKLPENWKQTDFFQKCGPGWMRRLTGEITIPPDKCLKFKKWLEKRLHHPAINRLFLKRILQAQTLQLSHQIDD